MIEISINARQLVKDLTAVGEQQLPYAMARALNETGEDVQADEQEHVARQFTLRRPTFIMNTIKINRGDFATKDKLRVIIGIDPERDVLSKFEDDGEKTATFAGHALAIPIEAKRSKTDIVAPSARPRALQLANVFASGSERIAKGIKGTFMIQKSDGSGGIFQRRGRGKGSSIHLLFILKTKVPLPRSLKFAENAARVVNEKLPANFQKWFAEAIRTAR